MRLRLLNGLALSLCATAWAVQSDVATIQDNRGDFSARLGNVHWNSVKNHTSFDSSGNSNTIWKNSEGLQIDAHRFSGHYTEGKQGKYNLDEVLAEGSVDIHYNSDAARKYQTTNGLKPSDAAGVTTELQSESAQFNQNPGEDTVTLTRPFVVLDNRPGKNDKGPTLSASKGTGNSGIFHFLAPENGGKAKLKTADVQGPVHYHVVQTTIDPETQKPTVTTYDILGDHLTADMTDPTVGHIVLDGHVKWSRTTQDGQGLNGTCSRLILTTDSDGNITDLEGLSDHITAQPAPKEKQP